MAADSHPTEKTVTGAVNTGHTLHLAEKIVLSVFLAAIIVLTVLGNLLVMVALCKDRQLRKKKTNYFIVSLAFADLLVALVVMPFAAIELTTGSWRYGKTCCLIRTSLDVLLTTASILHLCCIALDRYYAICCQPLVYRNKMTPIRVALMLGGCWIIPSIISFLPIMQSWNTIGIEDIIKERELSLAANETYCIFLVNGPYALVCSAVAFYVPLGLMALAYQRIYVTAMAHARHIGTLHRAGSAPEQQAGPDQQGTSRIKCALAGVDRLALAGLHQLGPQPLPVRLSEPCLPSRLPRHPLLWRRALRPAGQLWTLAAVPGLRQRDIRRTQAGFPTQSRPERQRAAVPLQ
nr:5-hydroxytryptamine receptor 4-like isoform X2 [Paramormyrops kingsleyae]